MCSCALSDSVCGVFVRETEFAVYSDAIVLDARVVVMRCGSNGRAYMIVVHRIRPRAHLTIIATDGRTLRRSRGCRPAMELVLREWLASGSSVLIVRNTRPHSREGKEDADDCENVGDNLSGDALNELERGENSYTYVSQISACSLAQGDEPGIDIVWQPIMKTICIGPNLGMLRRRL